MYGCSVGPVATSHVSTITMWRCEFWRCCKNSFLIADNCTRWRGIFSLREWCYRLYSLGRLCRLAQNMCQFIILMAVPLFLEFSGKAECRATFQFFRLFVWAGTNEKSVFVEEKTFQSQCMHGYLTMRCVKKVWRVLIGWRTRGFSKKSPLFFSIVFNQSHLRAVLFFKWIRTSKPK